MRVVPIFCPRGGWGRSSFRSMVRVLSNLSLSESEGQKLIEKYIVWRGGEGGGLGYTNILVRESVKNKGPAPTSLRIIAGTAIKI